LPQSGADLEFLLAFYWCTGALGLYSVRGLERIVNWADLMAAQGAFGTDFYARSNKTIRGTMLWTKYRHVLKSDTKDDP